MTILGPNFEVVHIIVHNFLWLTWADESNEVNSTDSSNRQTKSNFQ